MGEIVLNGSGKFITKSPSKACLVKKGEVYVYVITFKNDTPGRSIYLCESKEGEYIPELSALDKHNNEKFFFMLIAKNEALLSEEEPENLDTIRTNFGEKCDIDCSTIPFATAVRIWYNLNILSEKEDIERLHIAKDKVNNDREKLITSVFAGTGIKFDAQSPSTIYNAMGIYCDYMNIKMCSYQVLEGAYQNKFDIFDIAKESHFVVRKVTLEKNWYKSDIGSFITYRSGTNEPIICVPRIGNRYSAYDYVNGTEFYVTKDNVSEIDSECYIAYPHLGTGRMKLRDVLKFGVRSIKTGDIVKFFLLFILSTLIGLLMPVLNEQMYDRLIPLGIMQSIRQVGLVILSCMVGNVFFNMVKNFSSFRGVKSMEYTIMQATYERIFKLPQKFIEQFGTMELINRVNSVSGVFSQTVTAGVTAIVGFVLGIFYLIKMFSDAPTISWPIVWLSLLSGITVFIVGYIRISKEREHLEASTKANGMLYQFLSGILKIKVSGIENRALYEYEKANVDSLKYDQRSIKISNVGGLILSGFSTFISGFIYFYVVKKKAELSLGNYSSFMSAYGMFSSSVNQLIGFFLTMASLIPAMERIRPIFDEECEISEESSSVGRLSGNIEVSHLSFTYDGDINPTLKDISFKIKHGEFIGIVGSSGSGKSTLLKCLLGFEKPTRGNILYDDKSLDMLDKSAVRRQMGVVLQDSRTLTGNIYTNVTLASPNMSASDVEELLKEVGLYDDVEQMPMGVFTTISEGGGTVSGGQQQRILIARALANNPSIIFFDEATSALDNITQEEVCESLKKRSITRVMIAHRLSTVRNCDRIYVMDDGMIKESGTYEELIERKGIFYELAKRQSVEAV